MRIRMGLHTGEAHPTEERYVGLDVHRAARIAAAGHGGQILISQTTRDLVADDLPSGLSLQDFGQHRLKDLASPQHLYQVDAPGLPTQFPPLKSLENRQTNLPRQLTSFIGREREMAEVKRVLPTAFLLTLTGAGGSGKTRLALQVATDLLDDYPDGAWFVDLGPLSDSTLVPQAVASALGIREEPGRPPTETLANFLRSKSLLLVLDNCEHLLEASSMLVDGLLRACPGLRILATSREGLGIAGETLYPVPTLPVPKLEGGVPSEDLTSYEAVRLFTERARAVLPAFTLTDQNAQAVGQICRRLDGIPLAIELAAARVKVLPAEEIASRLGDQFKLLTGSRRTSLPRHQTLRAAMDWSYDLLSEHERALLRQLAVFAGGWTLEAAEAICICQGNGKPDVLDLLTRLVDKSLVVVNEYEGMGRYRLLETVRQYSQDRLLEQGEADAVRECHRAFFLALGEEAGPHLRGPEQLQYLNRLEAEHDNLRAALEWSQGGADPELGLRMAVAIWPLWRMRGHFKEGRNWLEATLAPTGAIRTKARASALRAAGTLARDQGDTVTARARFEESIAISQELNDQQGVADSLLALGHLPLIKGDSADAAAVFEETLSISQAIGYEWGIAESLHLLGHAALIRGEHPNAGALFKESVARFRELGNKWSSAHPLTDVGRDALRQGNYVDARSVLEEALTIFRELRSKSGIAMALGDLGDIAAAEGDYATAASRFEESLVLFRELGAKRAIANVLNAQAEITLHQGHYAEVRALIDEAMKLSKDLDKHEMARSLRILGGLTHRQDESERAKALFKESLTLSRAAGNKRAIIMCLVGLAGIGVQRELASGSRLLGAAESLRRQLGVPLPAMYHEEYERTVSALRAALGEEAFAVAWAEGQAMTLDQAVEFALDVDGV